MRMQIATTMCALVCGVLASPSLVIAQQKTVKACQAEWRANKATNQANGVTEKAYVAECRASATAQPAARPSTSETATPTPTTAAPPVPPARTTAGRKTIKACQDEWRENKAANQANGVTEKTYVEQCRAGIAPPQETAAPAQPPAPTPSAEPAPPAPAPTAVAPASKPSSPPPPTSTARPAPSTPAAPSAPNEFSTEAEAKAHCPSDTVVWASLTSKVYHFSGTRYYGHTKNGTYMCESDTAGAGMRAAKNEKHP
jgi:hypothetical protein